MDLDEDGDVLLEEFVDDHRKLPAPPSLISFADFFPTLA